MRENKKTNDRKEEEENVLIYECLFVNAFHSHCNNLIREEGKFTQK